MKDKIFGVLQRVGRSFMLPIAILPVAGLLLGLGSSFTNTTTIATYGLQGILGEGTLLHSLLIIMNKVGSAIFDNLPLIFAVGVAIGMAKKEKEVAALSALIAYFVMHISINSMLEISGKIAADGTISKNVLEGTIASVCGINTLQMGVFGGIIVGLGVGADIVASWTLIAEEAPSEDRAKHCGSAQFAWALGPAVVLLISAWINQFGLIGNRIVFAHLIIVAAWVWYQRLKMPESKDWNKLKKLNKNLLLKVKLNLFLKVKFYLV